MSDNTITVFLNELHNAQKEIIAERDRFNVVVCGRRFGKDILGHNLYSETGLDGFPAGWFSPTYKMLNDTWRDVTRILRPIATRINSQEHRIELLTGGVLDMWSLDTPDAARGRKYKRVIVNEAAFVPNLLEAWNFVIRPTLIDYQGDAWFLSTPKGRNGFATLAAWGQERRGGWKSWNYPTSANPFIPQSEIDEFQRNVTARVYEQEILAQFIDDGSFFTRVQDSATAQPQDKAQAGHEYTIGVDWARASGGDYTVFAVIDATTRELCNLVRMQGQPFDIQRARLAELHHRFNDAPILAEYNSMGAPLVEDLQRAGLPVTAFTTTAASKHEIITGLALALEQGELKLLNDATLLGELQAYEVKQRAGLPSYSAPDGLHDDTVIALALAWNHCNSGVSILFEV